MKLIRRLQSPWLWTTMIIALTMTLILVVPNIYAATDLGDIGSFAKWTKVEVSLTGPDSEGLSRDNNPFKKTVDVTFTSPNGQRFTVPGFYDGNGQGNLNGNVWKVRFSPNETGRWTFRSDSDTEQLNDHTGSFTVTEPTGCSPDGTLPDFFCVGRLESVGTAYLKFADGGYWLKGGLDDPEDFLADRNRGDIDYIASKGGNSIYLMLQNIDGDSQNVWPWVGSSQGEAKQNDEFFDVAKLAEWEDFFTYVQQRGIVLHLVFEDDSGWTGFNRDLYYREMIARFGHHNGLYWNIAEEYDENYSAGEAKEFARKIRAIDPYDHPVTIHHAGSTSKWEPFIGDANFGITSFQTSKEPQNQTAREWRNKVNGAIPVSFDETGQLDPDERDLARHIVWSVYLGGANYEMFTRGRWQSFAGHLEDMTRARLLLEQYDYWEMQPANDRIKSGNAYVFAQSGETYIAYLPTGGSIQLDVGGSGTFAATWFDPRNGNTQAIGNVGSGTQSLSAPNGQDWVLLVEKTVGGSAPTATPVPTAEPTATVVVDRPRTDPTPELTSPPTDQLITDVSARSGRAYEVTPLEVGSPAYTDRTYTWATLPEAYIGQASIRTANNDKSATDAEFLTFTLAQDAMVAVAYDTRITPLPNWLSDWVPTDLVLTSDDVDQTELRVYYKAFTAGVVTLGGNSATPAPKQSKSSNYVVIALARDVDTPPPAEPTTAPAPPEDLITDLQAKSGRTYKVATLSNGVPVYVDRAYTWTNIPAQYDGQLFIQSANSDKLAQDADFLRFSLSAPAVVYVAYDARIATLPGWLNDGTWADVGQVLDNTDSSQKVYGKEFPAGQVVLGGNGASGSSGASNYSVIVVPNDVP